MIVAENFKEHTCFRLERGQEKSACRVPFILVLHKKIAVVQFLRKANYGSASLKFCSHLQSADTKTEILPICI